MRGVRRLISDTKEWWNLSLLQQSVWEAASKSRVGGGGRGFLFREDTADAASAVNTLSLCQKLNILPKGEFKEEVRVRLNQFLQDKSSAFSSKFIIYNFKPSAYGSHTGTSKGQSNEEENAARLNYSHSVSRFLYLIPRAQINSHGAKTAVTFCDIRVPIGTLKMQQAARRGNATCYHFTFNSPPRAPDELLKICATLEGEFPPTASGASAYCVDSDDGLLAAQ